ncbi:hypothetical protein CGMCC3_g3552 [Colletotrichum fructicola]|nr:uncharacterized protein CGMCC3_g3552 [Colletotrichum fructicola]KAE9580608.1 hypothetical protein CGMCC3_g3552 [Colletotrichum fructicola]
MNTAERRHGFPSYSWAGWYGQIFFEGVVPFHETSAKKKNDWLSNQTWIIWYKYEPSTKQVSPVWDISQNSGFLVATDDDIGYRKRQPFRSQRAASRLSGNIGTTKPSQRGDTIDVTQYSYPLLQFWTATAYFKAIVSKSQETTKMKSLVLDIFDRNDNYSGCVYKNTASADNYVEESEPIELILLSKCWKPCDGSEQQALASIQEHMRLNSATKVYSNDYEDGCLFWALWIRWDGGVAERVGIAQIFQAAMEESLEPGPIWKEILLS